jgi:hypothetical protein
LFLDFLNKFLNFIFIFKCYFLVFLLFFNVLVAFLRVDGVRPVRPVLEHRVAGNVGGIATDRDAGQLQALGNVVVLKNSRV